jgi:hypothetical protein
MKKMMKLNKVIIAAVIGAVLAVGATFGIMNKVYRNNISEINASYIIQVTEINAARDSLKIHVDSVDFILAAYKADIDSLEIIDNKHRVEIDDLKVRLKKALNYMWDQYLEDNGLYAYDYLQGRYLSKDTLEYLFSGEQVVHIATDIIKGDYLDSLLIIEQNRILGLKNQVVKYKGLMDVLEEERDEFKFLTDKLYQQLVAKIEENKLSEEEIARLENALRKWRIGGAGALGFGLLLLILF